MIPDKDEHEVGLISLEKGQQIMLLTLIKRGMETETEMIHAFCGVKGKEWKAHKAEENLAKLKELLQRVSVWRSLAELAEKRAKQTL